MIRIHTILAAALVATCTFVGAVSAQTSKSKAPVRQGWKCTTEFYKIGTQVYGFQNDPLYGDIESIEEITYFTNDKDLDYSKLDEDSIFRTIYKFNSRGDVVECVEDWSDGSTYSYEYDAKGRLTKSTTVLYDGCTINTYEYDSQGRLVRELTYFKDDDYAFTCTYKYEYDKNGNLLLKECSGCDDDISYIITRKYDALNRLISNIEYDDEGGFTSYEYVYDSSNRVIEGYVRNYDGDVKHKNIYKYDATGKLADVYFSDCNGYCEKSYTFVYDKSGVLCGIIGPYGVTGPDYPNFQHIFTLNSKGEAVKSYFYGIDEFTRYYERDAKGNIVKIVEYFCNEKAPYRYIIRKIKYRK